MHIPVSVRDSGWPPSNLHSMPCDSKGVGWGGEERGGVLGVQCEGV